MRRDGRIPATFEVVYGHAWKGEPKRTAEGPPDRQAAAAAACRDAPDTERLRHRHRHRRRQDRTSRARCCARSSPPGARAAGMKPVAAGHRRTAPRSTPTSPRSRRPATSTRRSRDRNPYAFAPADRAAPRGAPRTASPSISPTIAAALRRASRRAPTSSSSKARAARWCRSATRARHARHRARLRLPVLLVVGDAPGCLNHALLVRARDPRARPDARGLGRQPHRPRACDARDDERRRAARSACRAAPCVADVAVRRDARRSILRRCRRLMRLGARVREAC